MHWMVHPSCRYCRHQGPLERICFTHLYRGWNEAWSSSRPEAINNLQVASPKTTIPGSHRIHVWKNLPTWMVKNGHIQQCWVSHFFWRFIILYPVKWTRMSIHIFLNSRQLKKNICEPKIWGFSAVFPYTKLSSH